MSMKLSIKNTESYLCVIISAILCGISRFDLPLDFMIFFAIIPLFRYFQLTTTEFKSKSLKYNIFRSFIHASIYSTIFLLISVHWISLVTIPGFIGILFLYAFYYTVFFSILNYGISRNPAHLPQFIILGFISLELILSYGPFKFPWLNLGYSLTHSRYLIQALEIGGVYLLSTLILVVNYLLFSIITGLKNKENSIKRLSLCLVILISSWWGFGYCRYHHLNTVKKKAKAGIVQVSIPQEMKWNPAFIDSTLTMYEQKSKELVKENAVDLVIWPEAAVPLYLMQWQESLNRMLFFTHSTGVNIFTGFPHFVEGVKYPQQPEPYLFYNSASQFKPYMQYDSLYSKNQLVPFGERIPFLEYFPILWKLQFGQANFERGGQYRYYQVKDALYSPLICYEVLFPDYVRKMMDKPVDFIVNITNDAWFKKSVGTYQHKMITVFRAVESRRPVFRSANTGYSVIINPRGDIEKELILYEKGTISAQIESCELKSVYHRIGFILPFLGLFLFFIEFILTIFTKNGKCAL
ncbi:MAG TPA: apolipoprotein N-acyltransferase [Candidatus Cloacimonadota bacterium]|nr:apolipoprotein N-acyltransferase [Candidatus Cloacimonadota bacterium]